MISTLTRRRGQAAEALAKAYLRMQGLTFVDQNVHCRYGEVDLIFSAAEQLIFIEVRYRKKALFGEAWETVNRSKQKKLITTANYYLQKKGLTNKVNCRFDILGLCPIDETTTQSNQTDYYRGHAITWFKDAFF